MSDEGQCNLCEKHVRHCDCVVCVGCGKLEAKEFTHNYPEGYYCEDCWDSFKG